MAQLRDCTDGAAISLTVGGACRGQEQLRKGTLVTIDDDLIIWLTKDLVS
jgi:hypothetical protein